VINLINFETQSPKQILVRAKVIEINRSDERQFGFDWGTANITTGTETVTNSSSGVTTTSTVPQDTATFTAQPILFTQPAVSDRNNALLGGGPLSRFQPFAAQLNALIQENKARVLSEPSLLVLDGNQGNILVGGQIPIPTSQSNSNSITVTYEPFGIRLNVTPVVVGDNTVQLTVTPEVSALDFGNAITVNGTTVPALTIRRVTTTLQMQSGQTLVIGGLYDSNYGKNVSRIPVLSEIPILGEFFKDTTNTKEETELLVLIETEIVTDTTSGIQPPPAGSNQNPGIVRPFVGNHEFQEDFPDIDKFVEPNSDNQDVPKQKISLPAGPGQDIGK
jgi:pilus assembly protein CpaC